MDSPFRKILAPMDVDQPSICALKLAERLVRDGAGTIFLLHVVAPDDYALLQEKYRPWESHGEVPLVCKVAEEILERTARERLGTTHREVLTRVGEVSETVLRVQREIGADLVVMGTHRERRPSEPGTGLAEHVMRNAACPVLTVREAK
jgi:nucleotide-binding universal stress UspA family protein